MTAAPPPLVIVHATDLHPGGGVAFAHALALARSSGATLYSVNASVQGQATRPMPEAAKVLSQWGAPATVEHLAVRHTCCDDPVDTLIDFLRRQPADLLVLATQQVSGLRRVLHDSVSEAVARNTHLPALFLPFGKPGFIDAQTGHSSLRTVVVPAESASEAKLALEALDRLVQVEGKAALQVVVLYVGEAAPFTVDDLSCDAAFPVRIASRKGRLNTEIARLVDEVNAGLVVMATRGHDGVRDMLWGSHTEQALHTLSCPLLSVPVHQ